MTITRYPACAEQAFSQLRPFESALQAGLLLNLSAHLCLAAETQAAHNRPETAMTLVDTATACYCAAGENLLDAHILEIA